MAGRHGRRQPVATGRSSSNGNGSSTSFQSPSGRGRVSCPICPRLAGRRPAIGDERRHATASLARRGHRVPAAAALEIRMDHALMVLWTTERPLAIVAEQSGYDSPSRFAERGRGAKRGCETSCPSLSRPNAW
ncbi:uncharacterized protein SOCE26_013100 [Sorangium cellulosum]|uniref:Uncharacterized protein n=1 Tax=Sorangium cellulosum TaxID=56 RepID=A0A2L0EKU8_SORCE|nr:uncharacterized protein SOCE26_013100 [Sorangium cellulosum]